MDVNGAMELLKEEMENDEICYRVNAIHKLKITCTVLGPDQIKAQLLPYLDQLIKKEEDEVLFAIAEELNTIATCLPGQQTIILPYLENLAAQEETVVRDRAVKSLINISATVTDNEINTHFIPLIMRLAQNEANFTCRVSAVQMMVTIYPRAHNHKDKIRQKFTELCTEETPMVRRAIASKIGEFSTTVEKEYVLQELIQNVKNLIQDDQDQVRVLGLNSLKLVAKVLNKDENKQHTLPIIIAATEDKSWRVRLSLSKIFADLAEAFGKEVADVSLIQIFTNLLRDTENDVRTASICSLSKFVKIVSPEKLIIIVPHIQYLARDSVYQVRAGAAEVIGILSGLLQKDIVTQKLLPHIHEMFNDDHKEVREGATKAAARFIENVGADSFQNFILGFKKSLEDPKWRVRLEGYDALIHLAKHFHNADLFLQKIEPLLMGYLKDKTAAVREEVAERIGVVVATYKNEWVFQKLIPKLLESLGNNSNTPYLTRLAAINTLKVVAKNLPADQAAEKILPILYKNLSDPVPNIRFYIVKSLKELAQKFDNPQIRNEMKQNLSHSLQDNDKDVKYFSNEVLQCINTGKF